MYKTIEKDYCPGSDRTTLYEITWTDNNYVQSIECVGWHCGEPYDGDEDYANRDYKCELEDPEVDYDV